MGIHHGLITADLGGGYYTVERGEWSGNKETVCVGVGDDDCDVCFNVINENTSDCAIELEYPPPQVTGDGTFVTAYSSTWRIIPLRVGSDCKIVNLGDFDADETTPIWQILSGLPTHVVEYKEEWDCCDGEDESGIETLISKTPVILIGKECAPITCGTCTP